MLGHNLIDDINQALPRALPMLLACGKRHTADSLANGRETIEWPGLFITEWTRPTRNVLFDPVRDANPFFHFIEAMWILAGRNDVKTLAYILPKMREFSDDGKVFHGPYGYRLRKWRGATEFEVETVDQVEAAIAILKHSPKSRQVVMGIWNPILDLGTTTKDVPCNDLVMLKVREGKLNITVANRSNDAVLGCYGANAVQFSMLQMYMAARLGLDVGTYCQVSDSFHVYSDNPYWQWFTLKYKEDPHYWQKDLNGSRAKYATLGDFNIFSIGTKFFEDELHTFWLEAEQAITTGGSEVPMFARSMAVRTAISLWNALHCHRQGNADRARTHVWDIEAADWRAAAYEWLERRKK